MAIDDGYKVWRDDPDAAETALVSRAKGELPLMESTKQLVRLLKPIYRPGMRILDVGCNVGHYLVGIKQLDPNVTYTGVDAYEHYIRKAREIHGQNDRIRFEVRDVHDPIFPDDPYDIVYCMNVLIHLPDFRKPFRNLINSTKRVCFVRTLVGDHTTIVKRAEGDRFDADGVPEKYVYQNTWKESYVTEYARGLGCDVEVIADEYDPQVLQAEYEKVKLTGTRIVDGVQADGNVIFNWKFVKMTPRGQG